MWVQFPKNFFGLFFLTFGLLGDDFRKCTAQQRVECLFRFSGYFEPDLLQRCETSSPKCSRRAGLYEKHWPIRLNSVRLQGLVKMQLNSNSTPVLSALFLA